MRFVEDYYLPLLRELGIGLVPCSPLGRGMLTGTLDRFDSLAENDRRKDHPRFTAENIDNNVGVIQPPMAIATEKGVSPSQLTIAWLLHQDDDIVPILGTKRRTHLAENMEVVDIDLSADDVARIGASVKPDAV